MSGCVLVTGASGMVGRVLVRFLEARGLEVRRLVRGDVRGPGEYRWNPVRGELDPAALDGVSAVVHLAGESIADGRWTAARRAAIRDSRVVGTAALVGAIASRRDRPEVLVSASAVGYYGDRGDEPLSEEAGPGSGFLAGVCVDWEREAAEVEQCGVRSVRLRLGVVLGPEGGALARMLPVFKAGAGGRLGSGRQWMSWIAVEDLAAICGEALQRAEWRGAFNAVAPVPVTNAAFTETLARVLGRPAVLAVPAAALKLLFGLMAEEALLASTRAVPARLEAAGFTWRHPDLEAVLRAALGRPS
jgi:hypothetical protein